MLKQAFSFIFFTKSLHKCVTFERYVCLIYCFIYDFQRFCIVSMPHSNSQLRRVPSGLYSINLQILDQQKNYKFNEKLFSIKITSQVIFAQPLIWSGYISSVNLKLSIFHATDHYLVLEHFIIAINQNGLLLISNRLLITILKYQFYSQ